MDEQRNKILSMFKEEFVELAMALALFSTATLVREGPDSEVFTSSVTVMTAIREFNEMVDREAST